MLKLGDEVKGQTFRQAWSGTVIGLSRVAYAKHERQALVKLHRPIQSPGEELITTLTVPRTYRFRPNRMKPLQPGRIMMQLTQYKVTYLDPECSPVPVYAHWAIEYDNRFEFFVLGRVSPIAIATDGPGVDRIKRVEVIGRGFPVVHPAEDRQKGNPNFICPGCATWVCLSCDEYERQGANRSVRGPEQHCNRCGGTTGEFIAVRHRNPNKHLDVTDVPSG